MLKHRGFPPRLSGSDLQFTIRRPAKKDVTPLKARERYADRKPVDRKADEVFLGALYYFFGEEPFERGNLDAGRLNWLFGREVKPGEDPFDPASYGAMLRLDMNVVRRNFPQVLAAEVNE